MANSSAFWESELFRTFAFYVSVLLFKVLSNNFTTVYYRSIRKCYRVEEDSKLVKAKHQAVEHPDVTRVVRIHEHDLENIIPFILIGSLFILTGPSLTLATWYFRIFTGARLVHTISYLFALQPARTIAHVVAVVILNLMVVSNIKYFM
ncbi:microsomal glutathione S-transferase 1-like [Dreissena polymorpha]|uniref:Microsomal glutathione S-transferase 1 n=1 Tax=Dreissena polymorpha TaxID=45954 RepID=A0A9D4JZ27_DREPO|nr:microsomal glutathione S-transferase 1-like [Dreissena polymorpha]KAH3830075.1 hypothetical protein DPMN_103312 [Dreissena polymorpha]